MSEKWPESEINNLNKHISAIEEKLKRDKKLSEGSRGILEFQMQRLRDQVLDRIKTYSERACEEWDRLTGESDD